MRGDLIRKFRSNSKGFVKPIWSEFVRKLNEILT